uniref:Vascular endothelial growth factor n=1 Tax=Podocoryna carnea TaxID=6096 RepID=Q674V2_PODCA|nr:vascular endothelial growth factor [Podocoryna carnea]
MKLTIFLLSFALFLLVTLDSVESTKKKKKVSNTFIWEKKKPYVPEPVPLDSNKKQPLPLDPLPGKKPNLNPKKLTKPDLTKKGTDFGKQKPQKTEKKLKPSEIWAKLSQVKSHEDFFNVFPMSKNINIRKVKIPKKLPKTSPDTQDDVGYFFSDATSGDAIASDPSAGTAPLLFTEYKCQPREAVVEIPVSSEGALWPACTVMKQCGGCCTHLQFKECVPTVLENIKATVMMIPYDYTRPKLHTVSFVQHKECACQCRLKPTDCNPKQTHDANSCKCQCLRSPEICPISKEWSNEMCDCACKQKQVTCPKRQIWSTDTCQCECEKSPCPQAHIRDPNTCLCVFLGQ